MSKTWKIILISAGSAIGTAAVSVLSYMKGKRDGIRTATLGEGTRASQQSEQRVHA